MRTKDDLMDYFICLTGCWNCVDARKYSGEEPCCRCINGVDGATEDYWRPKDECTGSSREDD